MKKLVAHAWLIIRSEALTKVARSGTSGSGTSSGRAEARPAGRAMMAKERILGGCLDQG